MCSHTNHYRAICDLDQKERVDIVLCRRHESNKLKSIQLPVRCWKRSHQELTRHFQIPINVFFVVVVLHPKYPPNKNTQLPTCLQKIL